MSKFTTFNMAVLAALALDSEASATIQAEVNKALNNAYVTGLTTGAKKAKGDPSFGDAELEALLEAAREEGFKDAESRYAGLTGQKTGIKRPRLSEVEKQRRELVATLNRDLRAKLGIGVKGAIPINKFTADQRALYFKGKAEIAEKIAAFDAEHVVPLADAVEGDTPEAVTSTVAAVGPEPALEVTMEADSVESTPAAA